MYDTIINSSTLTAGKNVLCIGDSLTAAGVWQQQLNSILGMNVSPHAKGGAGIITTTNGDGDTFLALTSSDVANKDYIVFFAGYNNRGTEEGVIGDLWPTQNTIAGQIQYVINTLHELLNSVGNEAWKNSGINKFNWDVYSASPTAMTGETVNDQLHLNTAVGYPWIGKKIAKFIDTLG